MTQRQLFILSFFVLIVLIFLQLVGVFELFIQPILWAVILALVVHPFYLRLCRLFGQRRTLAALVMVLVVAALVVAPMVFFSGTLVREVIDFYQEAAVWISQKKYETFWNHLLSSPLGHLWQSIQEKTAALEIDIAPVTVKMFEGLSNTIVGQIKAGTKNFVFFVLDFFVVMIALFFFLRDGKAMGQAFKDLFPMTRENKEMVFGRLAATVSAVVRGVLATGVTQGVLGGLAFWVLGVPFPVFLGLLIGFFALVPIGGAVVVWLPSAVYLALSGHWGKGLILFIWGAVVISTADNIVKPLVIGGKSRLPTLFLFFAILGGLKFYGLIGIFLGPVMLALFLTLIEIYRKEYPAAS